MRKSNKARVSDRRSTPQGLALAVFALSAVSANASDNAYYQPRTDWQRPTSGNLNISQFVFRDVNRNGVYDLGDRPMSGIAVTVTGAGRVRTQYSNLSGFANFLMSATDAAKDVVFAGSYIFETQLPPGWTSSTGNSTQTIDFELRAGSPAGLIALSPPQLVGIMPPLSIAGPASGARVTATGPDGAGVEPQSSADGQFALSTASGPWLIHYTWPNGDTRTRTVEVVNTPVRLSEASPGAGAPYEARRVTFDDLISEGIIKVPSGYGGLQWDNFVGTHQKFYDPSGYRNAVMSGEFVAYNGSGHPAAIFSDRPFTFEGGYFAGASFEAEGETLSIKAWRGDTLAYEEQFSLSALGPVHFVADYRDITRIDFETAHYWQFVCDDLTFSQ